MTSNGNLVTGQVAPNTAQVDILQTAGATPIAVTFIRIAGTYLTP
jgi:hypothetical protein